MEENKELLVEEQDDELETEEDDSGEYAKAKTFPVDESWPEELKKQVEQLNQMSAMLNADPDVSDDEPEAAEESEDEDDSEEETEEETTVQNVSTEETQTFNDIF